MSSTYMFSLPKMAVPRHSYPMPAAASRALLFLGCFSLWNATSANARLTNVVTDWVNATQYVVASTGAHNVPASRWYALVTVAMYNSLVTGNGKAPDQALAAYAGHAINSALFPWNQPARYDILIQEQLKNITESDRRAAAAIALPIADELLKQTAGGELARWPDFKPAVPGTPYAYQFLPNQTFAIYAQAANTTPWLLTFSEANAIAYNKDESKGHVFKPSQNDYLETVDIGEQDSKTRTQEQTDIAWFWSLAGNTSSVSGLWLDIGREVLPDHYSIADTALFYVRAALANWDAQLVGWRVKYSTLHWRPTTAFRQGFPGFTPVPNWTALIRVPNHPEYPSGHTVTVGSIWEVLRRTLNGNDEVTFSIASDSAPWIGKRTYTSLKQAVAEAEVSRLYGGVHFPAANVDGTTLGRTVASWVWDRIKPGSSVKLQQPRAMTAHTPVRAGKDLDGSNNAINFRKPWLTITAGR